MSLILRNNKPLFLRGDGDTSQTWVWNEVIPNDCPTLSEQVSYTVDGAQYKSMIVRREPDDEDNWHIILMYLSTSGDPLNVYSSSIGWLDEKYRTITLNETPSGTLLTYLQTYATQQKPASGLLTLAKQMRI